MAKDDKIKAVETLRTSLASAKGVYFADFQGMDVATATRLRVRCREAGVTFHVVKNTLTRRALEPGVREELDPVLQGPTAIAISETDQIVAAKVLNDFIKEFEKPVFKAGLVDGRVIGKREVETLAKLPGRDVLLSRFAGGLKSPLVRLHTALSSPLSKLAVALKQVAEQKAS
jgi:large subunit ribosomal protein L10